MTRLYKYILKKNIIASINPNYRPRHHIIDIVSIKFYKDCIQVEEIYTKGKDTCSYTEISNLTYNQLLNFLKTCNVTEDINF